MNIDIKVLNKKPKSKHTYSEIGLSEWRWRPIRSILAIANHRIYERSENLPIPYNDIRKLDDNRGFKFEDPIACEALGIEMLFLSQSMDILTEYGMQVDIKNGEYQYSYPIYSCTACLEEKETKEVIVEDDDYNEDDVRSCFWVSEEILTTVSEIIRDSGGIYLP